MSDSEGTVTAGNVLPIRDGLDPNPFGAGRISLLLEGSSGVSTWISEDDPNLIFVSGGASTQLTLSMQRSTAFALMQSLATVLMDAAPDIG